MTTHVVDQISDAIVALLIDATAAEDRITRDRRPADRIDVEELPTIDVRIGQDTALDDQFTNRWRSEVEIFVDLYAIAEQDRPLSKSLLELRTDSYKAIMAAMPALTAVPNVIKILPGGAEAISIHDEGTKATGYLRTSFFVTYQHSLTDPSV